MFLNNFREGYIIKEEEVDEQDYETEERELILQEIRLNAIRALDEIDVIIQELDMLETMEKLKNGQVQIKPQKPRVNFWKILNEISEDYQTKKYKFKRLTFIIPINRSPLETLF